MYSGKCVGRIADRSCCGDVAEISVGNRTRSGCAPSTLVAKEALKTGGSVYDLVLEKGWMTKEKLDDMLRPENMTDPREIPK